MTKKDYIAIAELIKAFKHHTMTKAELVDGLCNIMYTDNPRFDEAKFRAVCGEL
jgi:hypothetical protein